MIIYMRLYRKDNTMCCSDIKANRRFLVTRSLQLETTCHTLLKMRADGNWYSETTGKMLISSILSDIELVEYASTKEPVVFTPDVARLINTDDSYYLLECDYMKRSFTIMCMSIKEHLIEGL